MRIILVGFGTVGQSLARILHNDRERLLTNYGFKPEVIAIADSKNVVADEHGLDLKKILEVKKKSGTVLDKQGKDRINNSKLIASLDAEVLVECTPSNFDNAEPGMSHIKSALTHGKHVVTSNKGPLALAMPALLELASHHNRRLSFSATVGAGTPFLSLGRESLQGLKIKQIRGILNGTTNYILTRMEEASISFQSALKEAQKFGYAEENPSYDINGYDSAAKLVIIANWILKQKIALQNVEISGISKINQSQLKRARSSNKKVKLLCRVSTSGATVRPEPVSIQDPICVSGISNAVSFSTEYAGELTLTGPGAGGEQTASAILRDLTGIRREYEI